MKSLILFYSYSGNTKKTAEIIQRHTKADLTEILPVSSYPADYDACVNQAEKEVEAGIEPAIQELKVSIGDYQTIFVGTPVWWYTIAPPLRTVLTANKWKGKTVYPFATHGGGLGNTFAAVQKFCAGATVMKGIDIYFRGDNPAKSDEDIRNWINNK